MPQSPLRSPLNAVVKDVVAHPGNRLPFNKFISALLSNSGRVGTYYGESWDEILEYNAKQIAAGTPEGCVAFEDSAGTIPLLAPLGSGKGCGLLLDRSLGLVRGPELVTNGTFDTDSGWIKGTGWSITGGKAVIDGTNTASSFLSLVSGIAVVAGRMYRLSFDYSSTSGRIRFNPAFGSTTPLIPSGTSGTFTSVFTATATANISLAGQAPDANTVATIDNVSIREILGNHRIQTSATARGEMSRRVNRLTGTETLETQSITTVAASSVLSFSGAGSITLSGTATGTYAAGTHAITTTSGTLTLTVSGAVTQADFRYSADAGIGKTYQRVTTASDYDEEGFPARWKLKTDDWAKSSISPVGANRAFVLTALRVNSSASLGVLAEYGPTAASTDGTFSLESLSSQITLRVRGASAGTTVSASVADSSYVVIGALIDLASPRQELFINGVSAGASTAVIGSTTFVARDLFVAARNGASSFANADSTAPLMAVFMQPGDPGLTSAEISRLTAQFKKSIAGY